MEKFSAESVVLFSGGLQAVGGVLRHLPDHPDIQESRIGLISGIKSGADLISERLGEIGCSFSAAAAKRLAKEIDESWTGHLIRIDANQHTALAYFLENEGLIQSARQFTGGDVLLTPLAFQLLSE